MDIIGQLRQKVKILKLPKAKRFLILSCLPYCFRMRILVLNYFFFANNVRYGNSVTFRIGVTVESLQYLDNHESQGFDFVLNASQPIDLGSYIIIE